MGNRYFIPVICPHCGFRDDEVYYAPTCGILKWECPRCGHEINLEEYTGITKEDASNAGQIKSICEQIRGEYGHQNDSEG